jgi:hypothetical protein
VSTSSAAAVHRLQADRRPGLSSPFAIARRDGAGRARGSPARRGRGSPAVPAGRDAVRLFMAQFAVGGGRGSSRSCSRRFQPSARRAGPSRASHVRLRDLSASPRPDTETPRKQATVHDASLRLRSVVATVTLARNG